MVLRTRTASAVTSGPGRSGDVARKDQCWPCIRVEAVVRLTDSITGEDDDLEAVKVKC